MTDVSKRGREPGGTPTGGRSAGGNAGGDRLPVFFLRGAAHGFMLALMPHAHMSDPLPPMPSVREWLESYDTCPMGALDCGA